jgi:hypothetical protein
MLAVLAVFWLVLLVNLGADPIEWIMVPLLVVVLGLIWYVIRLGIYVSDYGMRIRSFTDWKTVPWHQVAAIEVNDLTPPPQIVIRTTLGGEIRTGVHRGYAGRYEIGVPSKSFDRLVTRLRELHQQATGPDPFTPDHR